MDPLDKEVLQPLAGIDTLARFMNSSFASPELLTDVWGIKPADIPARLLYYAIHRAGSYENILNAHGLERVGHRGEDFEGNLVVRVADPEVRKRFNLHEYYLYIDPGAAGDQTPTLAYVEGFFTYQAAMEALDRFLPQ